MKITEKIFVSSLIIFFGLVVSPWQISIAKDAPNINFRSVVNKNDQVCIRLREIYNTELKQFGIKDFNRHPNFVQMKEIRYNKNVNQFYSGIYTVDIDINNDGQKETINRLNYVQGNRSPYLTDDIYIYFPGHPYIRSRSEEFHTYHLHWKKRNKEHIDLEDMLIFANFAVSLYDAPPDIRVKDRVSGVNVDKYGHAFTASGQSITTSRCVMTLPFSHKSKNYFVVNSCISRESPPEVVLLLSYLPDKRLDVTCYLRREGANGKP